MFFIEPAHCDEFLLFNHQAGCSDRAYEVSDVRHAEIAGLVRRQKPMRMAGRIADADHHACMLDGAVGVKKLRAGCSDLGLEPHSASVLKASQGPRLRYRC